MRNTNKIIENVSTFLYPNVCLHCNDKGQDGLDLCRRCYQNLPWMTHACARCAMPLPTNSPSYCGFCINRNLYFDQTFASFIFDQFVREAVYQFKFNHRLNYGKLLAQLLARYIQNQNLAKPDVLIPVPLHRKRLRERGFNQALEIVRILDKQINSTISVKDIRRVRETHAQMKLPAKHRHANVKDAFKLRTSNSSFKGQHVIVVDDVMTTGNTVNEVAKCIKNAGAERIDVWCIARVA